MRVALLYASEVITPSALRGAVGICRAFLDGGTDARLLLPEPTSLPGCVSQAYDPGITAAWTSGWQRNWRLPVGLRAQLRRDPCDVVLCCGEPGDAAVARLAAGYGSGVPILTWFDALNAHDAALSQYADLHLAATVPQARRLQALPPPERPVALIPRPVPRLARLPHPPKGVQLLWCGRPDAASGLPLLLDAMRSLPEDWSLTITGSAAPDDEMMRLIGTAAARCTLQPPAADPWESVQSASLCVVTSDRPGEAAAIAEAAARHLPVAAVAGVNGARDLLADDAPLPEEAQLLAAALRTLQRDVLQQLGRRQADRAQAARRGAAPRLADALRYLPPAAAGGRRA